MSTESLSQGARARARAEITRTIQETARRHLAEVGPAALSLRAIARDVGMVSSAVYRYFPSRDDLLTALIVEAYDEVGEQAERADRACHRADLGGRFGAVCRAVRDWALTHPHEYALLYGSPVPGYQAPQTTVGPASRVPLVLLGIAADAQRAGPAPIAPAVQVPDAERAALSGIQVLLDEPINDSLLARCLQSWATLFGHVSLELFGHMHTAVLDYDAHFEHVVRQLVADLGLDR
ncbi:TetR/AcrR family transcriptional regulator [Nocardioides ferulae]|uniref:TetR/AcrR family transcriptional regulator n=1 Tax=Nocardioides ferulae TaxID=2340821 RepID=UPI001F0BA340|nr:TetR/AcrR family transcriptional regulator [Nocardioides ferulae]